MRHPYNIASTTEALVTRARRIGWIAAGCTLLAAAAPMPASAQQPAHGVHPPLPNQRYYFECRISSSDKPVIVEVPLEMHTASSPRELNQKIEVHDAVPPLRLTHYLPRAVLNQKIEPSDQQGGRAALRISIDGPTQSFQRWLVAGDLARNRLQSFVGTWRYQTIGSLAERAELLALFKRELDRNPVLQIARPDRGLMRTVPAVAGTEHALADLGCTVRVREFYPHFALKDKTHKPANLSDRRVNPAALVELAYEGRTSEFWVFARFPEFDKRDSKDSPYRLTLDCPVAKQRSTPDFMLTTDPGGALGLWTRWQNEVTAETLELDKDIKIMGSQYSFRILKFVPRGRLVESYAPTDRSDGVPALRVETTDVTGRPVVRWLKYGTPRVLKTALGPMSIAFGPRSNRAPGAH